MSAASYESPTLRQITHKCGVCKTPVLTARWRDTGILVHVEKISERGRGGKRLDLVPELFAPQGPPHVEVRSLGRFVQHRCP